MVTSMVELKVIDELKKLSSDLSTDLIASTSKIPRLLNYQITLLEIFKREIKKLDHLGTCDYEIAYVSFRITNNLYNHCLKSGEQKDFVVQIKKTLDKDFIAFKTINDFLDRAPKSPSSVSSLDPLMARLASLKASKGSHDLAKPNGVINSKPLDKFKYREIITPYELEALIRSPSRPKILLIDFRTAKEFNYSHINYSEIVNIEPSHINSLITAKHRTFDQLNDMDLEERLKMHLTEEQFERFQNRHRYDLVIIYNLRYGPGGGGVDRFQALKNLLINDDKSGLPSANPFQPLIELLTFKNKYLSSRLKSHPLFLAGGLFYWHSVFGDSSLKRSLPTQILTRPQASLSKGGSESPSSSRSSSFTSSTNSHRRSADIDSNRSTSSPYLRNFGDYLSTAKSTSSTPVSNTFISSQDLSVPMNVHNYGRPLSLGPHHTDTPPQQQAPKTPKRSMSNGSSSVQRSRSRSNSTLSIEHKLPSTVSASAPNVSQSPSKPPMRKIASSSQNPVKFLDQYTTGLTNLGNSCYMNCVLQCLGATPQLTRFFFPTTSSSATSSTSLQSYRQHINLNNKLGSKGILTTNFVSLLGNMFQNSGKYFAPHDFKRVVGSLSPCQQFASFDQQDCIEFLNFILDGLHEDLNQMIIDNPQEKKAITELTPEQEKTREILPVRLALTIEWERYLKLNFSIIVDYFQGQYLSQLRCLECNSTSTTYNAFSILSLPIPQKLGNPNVPVLLDECLKEFTATELLDDNNKWHCSSCKKFTKLTKKITITRLPEVLIIHFKRFKMIPSGYINKMDTFVTYPVNDVLDLTSYWPEVGTTINSTLGQSMTKEKEQLILSTLPTRNQQPPFRYKLYGVANHFGNLSTGHYTSYVHKANDSKKTRNWCYFDDAKVTYNVKESQVLNKNAYCLFYQRV